MEIDKDTVSPEELESLFTKKYNLLAETAVTLKKSYINKLSVSKSLNIAVCQQDNSIEVYRLDKSSLSKVCRLSGHKKALTELVFSSKEENLLYSAGHDGVKLWDIRTSGLCVQEYKDEEDCQPRAYECMDVSCTGRVICAGSELVQTDAYIVFWDQRKPEPLGGYWNSHMEDITQVKFHKNKSETLASGSQDGIINIYNIDEATEDDALIYSLNVGQSVEKITWLNNDQLACTTQPVLQIWDASTADKLKHYDREKISRSMKRSSADDCYIVDAYMDADERPVVLAGSLAGDGHVLRSLSVADKKLQPRSVFARNAQLVRCCVRDQHRDLLVTTGESGLISVWGGAPEPDEEAVPKKLSKSLRIHDNRHRPY